MAARRVLQSIPVDGADELDVEIIGDVVHLRGRLARWDDVIEVGHAVAAEPGLSNLIYEVKAADEPEPTPPTPKPEHPIGTLPARADAVVVGGGIVGMAVARGLVCCGLKALVLEAGDSIGGQTTSWNNGMIHSGFDPAPGTLKAELNVRGNALWPTLAAELDLPFLATGSLLVALDEAEIGELRRYLERAQKNGVPGAEIIDGRCALELEPRLNSNVLAALWTPTTAYIDPVEATRAMAEDVREHGGAVVLCAPVTGVGVEAGRVVGVRTSTAQVETELVINAAGLHADQVAAMAGCQRYSLHPRRGTLILFDEGVEAPTRRAVGLPPIQYTKGGGMTPRPGGVMVGGPTAIEQSDRYEATPTSEEIDEIFEKGATLLPSFPFDSAYAVGAGLRAATYAEDFVVGPDPDVERFFHVAGMQSPGVASVSAVAEFVVERLRADGLVGPPDASFTTRAGRRAARRRVTAHNKGGDHA